MKTTHCLQLLAPLLVLRMFPGSLQEMSDPSIAQVCPQGAHEEGQASLQNGSRGNGEVAIVNMEEVKQTPIETDLRYLLIHSCLFMEY